MDSQKQLALSVLEWLRVSQSFAGEDADGLEVAPTQCVEFGVPSYMMIMRE